MRTLDRYVDIEFGIFWLLAFLRLCVPHCGAKITFTTEIQSKEVSRVGHFCFLHDFMNVNVNEAKKLTTFNLAQLNSR